MSFVNIHEMCNRATPEMLLRYKMALSLYKTYNLKFNSIEFTALNFNQILTRRQTKFFTLKSNKFKVGGNSLANRFYLLNNKITLTLLNLSLNSFKIKCINLFLKI